MSHNSEQLKTHIVELSESNNFTFAKKEWVFTRAEYSEDYDRCPCGQSIKELCHIENVKTGHRTYVGNTCIKKFMGIDKSKIFHGLKKIKANDEAIPNRALIEYAVEQGFIYENEEGFLLSIMNKRSLTTRQAEWLQKINRRIINGITVKR